MIKRSTVENGFTLLLDGEALPVRSGDVLGIWIAKASATARSDFGLVRHETPPTWTGRFACRFRETHEKCTTAVRVLTHGERSVVIFCAGQVADCMINPRYSGRLDVDVDFPLPNGESLTVTADEVITTDLAFTVVRHFFHYGVLPSWLTYRHWRSFSIQSACGMLYTTRP